MSTQAELIVADDRHRAGGKRFNTRVFRRLVGVAMPFKRMLILGMLCTLGYAGLQTASLAGVFPVFKILAEDEGVIGWIDRTAAGSRLKVDFAPTPSEQAVELRLLKVKEASALHEDGLRSFAVIQATSGLEARAVLAQLAAGNEAQVQVLDGGTGADHAPTTVTLAPIAPPAQARFLLWLRSHIPAGASPLSMLLTILGIVLVVVLFANLFRYFSEVLIAAAVLRSMMGLRATLYERVLNLPMAFFAGEETSAIVSRFVQDIQEIQQGLNTLFSKFIREPLRAMFILAGAFFFDWRITLVMVVVAPLAVIMFWVIGRKVKKASKRLLMEYGRMIGALTTSFQSIRVVKAYTAEEEERQRLKAVDWQMFKHQLRLAKLRAFTSPMMETVAVIAGSLLTVWLATRVLNQQTEMSKFLTLGVFLSMLFDPLRRLSEVYVRLQRSTAGGERIFQVVDAPIESDLQDGSENVGPLREAIRYEGVTFTYPAAESPALVEIDLAIEKGQTVAIVGPNGCGKTTLVSLLPRFFDPNKGVIRWDGLDLRRADLSALRGQISLVSQEAVVFAGTPVDNIAYGIAGPDLERVKGAARRAHAEEFILGLPNGYDEILGERGTTLSGGQRQRLVIARAIYRDAPVLIFDEATSQIDSESEQKIQQALREFAEDRTTLIIAHRLSTIQFADHIVVMDAGRIIDSGTHGELLTRCTLYRTLCETQFFGES